MNIRLLVFLLALVAACNSEKPAPTPEAKAPSVPSAALASAPAPAPAAEIGKPAPDFTLTDYEGKSHHLADHRGKIVVLEWFNPDCPFVKNSYTKGSLKGLSKRLAEKGVVWIGINSNAKGKQGNGPERVAEGKKAFGIDNVIVADETGNVGKMYGATNTPHMYVIDAKGTLVYRGAIDNSPDGEGESPTDGKLRNHVESAVEDLLAGRAVQVTDTKAYGCSVKYGS
ncbi:MAG: thioredoxin family protein [Polyangiaceae bacterium]|nr:thioredoxin family protein [Polyangiaceae bacterium]